MENNTINKGYRKIILRKLIFALHFNEKIVTLRPKLVISC